MTTQTMHASCVAWGDAAVLIKGAAGTGKSALALELMAYGCVLVADDQVLLTCDTGSITASPPPTIAGLIEARGFGILTAGYKPNAKVTCVVDLDLTTTDRIPPPHTVTVSGCDLTLFHRPIGVGIGPVILQFLRAGLSER